MINKIIKESCQSKTNVILVGYTGFVGKNLMNSFKFDALFNSKNISDAYNTEPDILVYAGVPGTKFLANLYPQNDLEIINNAKMNIRKINPKKLVLISTVDVYDTPVNKTEIDKPSVDQISSYGRNRAELEDWVTANVKNYLIVRLPAIYGIGLKKNFIYDITEEIPAYLNIAKYEELINIDKRISKYYEKENDCFYHCKSLTRNERKILLKYLISAKFTTLFFTDSRSSFQFYNLEYLWGHINIALKNDIKILNLVVEPLSAAEVYFGIFNKTFLNDSRDKNIFNYNLKTIYADIFGGKNGYIFDRNYILDDLKYFVLHSKKQ
ncbi:MAG: NAD(P)-dependent oxidoreductase [Erysipelotrichaceae bacterium]